MLENYDEDECLICRGNIPEDERTVPVVVGDGPMAERIGSFCETCHDEVVD